MFIVSLTYTASLEEVNRHMEAHVAYLKDEYERGSFIATGPKVPRSGGVMLSTLTDREKLEAAVAADPFRMAGIAEYEIIEFTPTMVGDGYENLL